MLFNSLTFLLVFLPLGFALWWTVKGRTARLVLLGAMNTVFYAWFDIRFVAVLVFISLAGYYGAAAVDSASAQSERRRRLVIAVAVHLAALVAFRYVNFLASSLTDATRLLGLDIGTPGSSAFFPIGLAFYCLNSLSYLVDVYRGDARRDRSLLEYYAFVGLFPHLLAGPILRFTEIGPQLRRLPLRPDWSLIYGGLILLGVGLAKKILLADHLAPVVDRSFDADADLQLIEAWSVAAGYTLQLYFDFSAYSDMAIGVAAMFGFRFPQNFNSPLQARNPSDFWRRWHMTLSRWMRDYIYIPLGGSRGSTARTARNLGATMLVAGLWHGAAWTFVIWGLYHGLLLAIHHAWRGRHLLPGRLRSASTTFARVGTLVAVVVGFVVFKAANISDAVSIYGGMLGVNGLGLSRGSLDTLGFEFVGFLLIAAVLSQIRPNSWSLGTTPRPRLAVAVGVLMGIAVLSISSPSPFLYFKF